MPTARGELFKAMTEHPIHTLQSGVDAGWLRRGGWPIPGPPDGAEITRLFVLGDTHGNLDWIRSAAKQARRLNCHAIVQLGDFGLWPDMRVMRNEGRAVLNERFLDAVAGSFAHHQMRLLFLDGNHDAHELARAKYPADAVTGIRAIRDGVISWADRGSVWDWHGVKFGALGGATSIDKDARVEGRSWWPTEEITEVELQTLLDRANGSVDVLLTHDAPALVPTLPPLSDPVMRARCERSMSMVARAVDALKPQVLLHGHLHVRYSGLIGRTRWEALASDEENHLPGHSWSILELPSLAVITAADLQRERQP